MGIYDESLLKLYNLRNWEIREDNPIPFNWPSKLRRSIWDTLHDKDSLEPLILKQYQLQAIHSLARMPRMILGDGTGLGKTLSAIAASTWVADHMPVKIIVLCTKSMSLQWSDEFKRFSTLRTTVIQDRYGKKKSYAARYQQMEEFFAEDRQDVLICRYTSMIGKRRQVKEQFDSNGFPVQGGVERVSQEIQRFAKILAPHGDRVILILDEGQKFKSTTAQIRVMVQHFQKPCRFVWVLTATAMKNSLDEFYSVASAIGIRPFGYMRDFYDEFCIFRDVYIGQGRYKKTLQGYRNVATFKAGMRPFFLGRSQRQVKEKLPKLVTLIHPLDLDDEQRRLLLEDIPSGKYQLPPAVIKIAGEIVTRERDIENDMTLFSVFQMVANHPALLEPGDRKRFLTHHLSPKEEALLDLLDGDLKGEHVVVFSKFRSHIDRLEALTKERAFTDRKFLRVTGAESEQQRHDAKQKFQHPNGDHDLIFINSAATEGINLQRAAHMVALDLPFSFGDCLQLLGRMLRLMSPHDCCTLHILVARGSLDEFVLETLCSKQVIFNAVFGSSNSTGFLDDGREIDLDSGMEQVGTDAEFLSLMKAHSKSVGMRRFLSGETLTAAQSDGYKMAFESDGKKRPSSRDDYDFDEMVSKWHTH